MRRARPVAAANGPPGGPLRRWAKATSLAAAAAGQRGRRLAVGKPARTGTRSEAARKPTEAVARRRRSPKRTAQRGRGSLSARAARTKPAALQRRCLPWQAPTISDRRALHPCWTAAGLPAVAADALSAGAPLDTGTRPEAARASDNSWRKHHDRGARARRDRCGHGHGRNARYESAAIRPPGEWRRARAGWRRRAARAAGRIAATPRRAPRRRSRPRRTRGRNERRAHGEKRVRTGTRLRPRARRATGGATAPRRRGARARGDRCGHGHGQNARYALAA